MLSKTLPGWTNNTVLRELNPQTDIEEKRLLSQNKSDRRRLSMSSYKLLSQG